MRMTHTIRSLAENTEEFSREIFGRSAEWRYHKISNIIMVTVGW